MIKPGTLCYIVRSAYADWVGRIVTAGQVVIKPGDIGWDKEGPFVAAEIEVQMFADWLPSGDWCIKVSDLRPIHGPAAEQSIRETDTVRDHDEITRRLTA